MQRFRRKRPEVPHHRRRLQICFRVTFLRVNKIAEFQRVAYEEHRRIISGHLPIAFFGVKLQSKAARIALRVFRSFFATAIFPPEFSPTTDVDGLQLLQQGSYLSLTSTYCSNI